MQIKEANNQISTNKIKHVRHHDFPQNKFG